jgi:hypothetical protein
LEATNDGVTRAVDHTSEAFNPLHPGQLTAVRFEDDGKTLRGLLCTQQGLSKSRQHGTSRGQFCFASRLQRHGIYHVSETFTAVVHARKQGA